MDFLARHSFLRLYLQYVAQTESPRIFHVWAGLSAISACLGRRCWMPSGIGEIWPNMYVVLVGPPATRKGAAIKFAKTLLDKNTLVKFAPNDTGGQRQGLIKAMTDTGEPEGGAEEIASLMSQVRAETGETFAGIMGARDVLDKLNSVQFDTRDPRTMYIVASELNSILGENNTQMLTFLQEMWDGVPYRYQLRNTEYEIKDGLLSILGGTTPAQIALAMPSQAIGQGFTSRIIFVYADTQFKRIARPALDEKAAATIGGIFGTIFNKFEGPFSESAEAATEMDRLYMRGVTLSDPRFLHYIERRQTHLYKTAMALAAGRGEMTIELVDVQLADRLLLYTEQYMTDALGEYGMNKLGAAKQKLLECIRGSNTHIPISTLRGLMHKDMTPVELQVALSDLHNGKKITLVTVPQIGQCVIAVDDTSARRSRADFSDIIDLMEYKDKA